MKKLTFSLVVALSTFSIYASPTVNPNVKIQKSVESDFVEISIDALPPLLLTTVLDAYPGVIILKTYVNEYNEYQVDISIDEETASVYLDIEGNWLKL